MGKYRFLLLGLIVILVVVLGYVGWLYLNPKNATPQSTSNVANQNIPSNAPVLNYQGVISCLPIKPNDPYQDTDGCALGLKTSDGKYYILEGNLVTPDNLVEGLNLRVTGSIDTTSSSLHYDVAGFINATNIVKLNK